MVVDRSYPVPMPDIASYAAEVRVAVLEVEIRRTGSTLNLDPSGTRERRRPRSLEPRAGARRARAGAVRRGRVRERATGSTRERECPIARAFSKTDLITDTT